MPLDRALPEFVDSELSADGLLETRSTNTPGPTNQRSPKQRTREPPRGRRIPLPRKRRIRKKREKQRLRAATQRQDTSNTRARDQRLHQGHRRMLLAPQAELTGDPSSSTARANKHTDLPTTAGAFADMVRFDEITITLTARRTTLETDHRNLNAPASGQLEHPGTVSVDEPPRPDHVVTLDHFAAEPSADVDPTDRSSAAHTPFEVELDELPAAATAATPRSHGIARRNARAALRKHLSPTPTSLQTATPELPDFRREGPIDRMPLSSLQRMTAEHLDRSWKAIPHVTQQAQIDVTDLELQRRAYNRAGGERRTASLTAIVIKAAALALEMHPHLNASLDIERGELVLKDYVNIGVVLDLPEGLVIPVVRNVDTLCLDEIEQQLGRLTIKARTGTLEADDLRGATFSIFDRDSGGTARHECVHDLGFTPIVPWPQVAILGTSPSRQQLVLLDDRPQARLMLPVSMSFDQRVMNGSDATRFLGCFCDVLHQPFELLCAA